MIRAFAITLGILLGTMLGQATAKDYYVQAAQDEFYWKDPYWVSRIDGGSYVRTWIDDSYYLYGCYYQTGHWRYVPVAQVQAQAQQTQQFQYTIPSLDDPYFERKVADIMAARDQFEGGIRARAAQHNQRLELLKETGLSGNFAWQGYGAAPAMANPFRYTSSAFLGNFGVNGPSVYGVNSQIDAYGTLELDTKFQQMSAHTQQAMKLADNASNGFNKVVGTAVDGHAKAAELREKRLAAQALMGQVRPEPRTTITQRVTSPMPIQSNINVKRGAGAVTTAAKDFKMVASKCIACHGDQNPAGGYQVMRHHLLSDDQQMEIVTDILLAERGSAKLMPRLGDRKTAGEPLPADEILFFVPPSKRAEAVKMLSLIHD